jgi:hypothetical protein
MSLRCACPGTNWVNELTTAITGALNWFSFMPLARHKARAPAILGPTLVMLLRNECVLFSINSLKKALPVYSEGPNATITYYYTLIAPWFC